MQTSTLFTSKITLSYQRDFSYAQVSAWRICTEFALTTSFWTMHYTTPECQSFYRYVHCHYIFLCVAYSQRGQLGSGFHPYSSWPNVHRYEMHIHQSFSAAVLRHKAREELNQKVTGCSLFFANFDNSCTAMIAITVPYNTKNNKTVGFWCPRLVGYLWPARRFWHVNKVVHSFNDT